MADRNIFIQINEVMKKVTHAEKTGYNSFQKYNYSSDEDIVKALRTAMVEAGLVMYPNIIKEEKTESVDDKGKASILTTVMVEFTLTDVVSGTSFKTVVPGYGKDSGDKGIYKALTGAKKYFLAQTFNLVLGDDPEKDEETAPAPAGKGNKQGETGIDTITDSQKKSIGSLIKAKEVTKEDYLKILKDKAKKDNTNNLTKAEASKVIEALTAYKSVSQ